MGRVITPVTRDEKISAGDVRGTGNGAVVREFVGLFEEFELWLDVGTP